METTHHQQSGDPMPTDSVTAEYPAAAARRVAMLSLHTSPLAQAGRGDAGGLNVYVNALSAALAAQGVEVDIITTDLDDQFGHSGTSDDDVMRVLPDGRRIHILGVRRTCQQDKSRLLECIEDLARRSVKSLLEASAREVDVIHSHYWISGLAGIEAVDRLCRTQHLRPDLVHTMHTIGAVKRELDPQAIDDPRRDDAEQQIANAATLLTANTRREAQDLHRHFTINADRIRLVQPGADLSVFYPPQAPAPRHQGAESSAQRPLKLTFAGRLQPHKGPHVAVAAVGRLRAQHPQIPIQLTIAGRQSGADAVDIPALVEEAGIADVVYLTEPLPHPELAQLLRSSDAVVMPSYSESFGLVALEAMACGTPVLAHAVGGLAELIRHGETGLLLETLDPEDWADAVEYVAKNRSVWSRYSASAADWAHQFSWHSTAEQAIAAYGSTAALAESVHVAGAPS